MPGIPEVCSVLSHELRTPLTVLQGYLRLIQRGPGTPNPAHVAALLDATAQVATLGRQASELAACLQGLAPQANATGVPVALLLQALSDAAAAASPYDIAFDAPPAPPAGTLTPGGEAGPIAGAVVAVATAVARHAEATRARLSIGPPARHALTLRAVATAAPLPPPLSDLPGDTRPWFMSGGFGLTLVSSALILECVGGRVQWLPQERAAVVSLPMDTHP